MRKTAVLLMVLVLVLGTVAMARAAESRDGQWEISAGVWMPAISGNIKQGNDSANLKGDLGLSDPTSLILGVRYSWRPDTSLALSYFNIDSSGSSTLSKNINYGGKTYPVNSAITSKLTFSSLEAAYERALYQAEGGGQLNYILGLKSVSAKVGVYQGATTSEVSGSAVIPEIGLSGRAPFSDAFGVHARVTWIGGSAAGISGSMTDLSGGLDYNFTPDFSINADYRYINIQGNANNDNIDAGFGGLMGTLNYRF